MAQPIRPRSAEYDDFGNVIMPERQRNSTAYQVRVEYEGPLDACLRLVERVKDIEGFNLDLEMRYRADYGTVTVTSASGGFARILAGLRVIHDHASDLDLYVE